MAPKTPDLKLVHPPRLTARQKQDRALELRMSGAKWKTIAEHLGYRSEASAYKAAQKAMERLVQEPAQDLRKLELERLDRMLMALWPEAMNGKWLAIDRCLKIMERKAVMLGLDAPQRRIVDVITHDAFAQAMDELTKEIDELEKSGESNSDIEALRKQSKDLAAGAPAE